MKSLSFFRLSVLLCCLALSTQAAQAERADPLKDWNNRLQSTRTHLLAGEHQQALDIVVPLQHEMMEGIQSGPGVARSLGITVLLRALAEAGVGEMEAAAWDWHAAKALDPSMAEMDLTSFGVAGEALNSLTPIPRNEEAEQALEKLKKGGSQKDSGETVERPKAISTKTPKYPGALRKTCEQGVVELEMILDKEGRPRSPGLKSSEANPVMALAALEAVRTWRFEPARYKGETVNVYYTLTVSFTIPFGCVRQR